MADQPDVPLASVEQPNGGKPPVPASINMPDHWLRQNAWYQAFVRLGRPTLDWITNAMVIHAGIIRPAKDKFDLAYLLAVLAWAAAVYSIKTYEKKQGVA